MVYPSSHLPIVSSIYNFIKKERSSAPICSIIASIRFWKLCHLHSNRVLFSASALLWHHTAYFSPTLPSRFFSYLQKYCKFVDFLFDYLHLLVVCDYIFLFWAFIENHNLDSFVWKIIDFNCFVGWHSMIFPISIQFDMK